MSKMASLELIPLNQVSAIPFTAEIYPTITASANEKCKAALFLNSQTVVQSFLRVDAKPALCDSLLLKLEINRMQKETLDSKEKHEVLGSVIALPPTKVWDSILEAADASFLLAIDFFSGEPKNNADRVEWNMKYWYYKAALLLGKDCVMRLGTLNRVGNLSVFKTENPVQIELHKMNALHSDAERLNKDGGLKLVQDRVTVNWEKVKQEVCSDGFCIEEYKEEVCSDGEKFKDEEEQDTVLC